MTSIDDTRSLRADLPSRWHRRGMLMIYYRPMVARTLAVYLFVPMVLMLAVGALCAATGSLLSWMYMVPMWLLMYLSPLMLTRRDYRFTSAQLPLGAADRLAVLLLIVWVLYPGLATLGMLAGEQLSEWLLPVTVYDRLQTWIHDNTPQDALSLSASIAIYYGVVTVVLYYTVTARGSRTIAGVMAMVVTLVATVFVEGVIGMVLGLMQGWHDAQAGVELPEAPDIASMGSEVMARIMSVVWISNLCLSVGILGVFLTKLYRKLRYSGF